MYRELSPRPGQSGPASRSSPFFRSSLGPPRVTLSGNERIDGAERGWNLLGLEDRLTPAALWQPGIPFATNEVLAFVREGGIPAGRAILTNVDGTLYRVPVPASSDPNSFVNGLSARPGIDWASPNYFASPAAGREFTPNDPQFNSQYRLAKTQAPTAWDTTTGSPAVVVAIADDGLAVNHPDIAGLVWVNPGEVAGNGLDDDGNGFMDDGNGWDFVDGDNSVTPENLDTHGAHVAGIVGARTNNGVGVSGIAGGGPNGADRQHEPNLRRRRRDGRDRLPRLPPPVFHLDLIVPSRLTEIPDHPYPVEHGGFRF
jgi:hypothetical protein